MDWKSKDQSDYEYPLLYPLLSASAKLSVDWTHMYKMIIVSNFLKSGQFDLIDKINPIDYNFV